MSNGFHFFRCAGCVLACSALLAACSTVPEVTEEEEPFGLPILDETVEPAESTPSPDPQAEPVVTNATPAAVREQPPLLFIDKPSPNHNERTAPVSIIMLHYTAGGTTSSLRHLTNPKAPEPVSAHYVVDRGGSIFRLVDESKRAWHAGAGSWQGQTDVNSASVGIEIVNAGRDAQGRREPYPARQIEAVIRLCQDIQKRHDIRWVLGHSDTGLGRKDDPGEHFPWKKLAEAGVGLWTDAFEKPVLSRRAMLSALGYDIKDLSLATVAFQRHFYPEAITSNGKRTDERMAAVLKKVINGH